MHGPTTYMYVGINPYCSHVNPGVGNEVGMGHGRDLSQTYLHHS